MSPCASFADCGSCAATMGCHWCFGACHAYLSPSGCLIGENCTEVEKCFRTEPEFWDFDSVTPTVRVIVGFIIVTTLFFSCGMGCAWCARTAWTAFSNCVWGTPESRAEEYYRQLVPLQSSEGTGNLESPLPSEENQNRTEVRDERRLSQRWFPGDDAPLRRMLQRSPAARRACGALCFLWVVATIVVGLGSVVYFPESPTFNVCNSRFDWSHLLKSLASSASLRGDFALHVSVWNPNRFGLILTAASIEFVHNGNVVGKFEHAVEDEKFSIPGGSIHDMYISTKFSPSVSEAVELLRQYESNSLKLITQGSVDLHVIIRNTTIYDVKYTLSPFELHLDDVQDDLCKCPVSK